jgi:allantoin racemase
MSPSSSPLRILDLLPVVYTRDLEHAFEDRKNLAKELSLQTGGTIELLLDSLPKGTTSIEDAYDEAINVPHILAKIRTAESKQCSAVIIDCFGDPGLDAARELVRMPVIGVAQSTCHLAAQIAPRFSIINTVREFAHLDRELVTKYGVTQHLASIITIDIPVLALEAQQKRAVNALAAATRKAVREDGAQAIVLGCTGMSSLATALKKKLARSGIEAPIIEPLRAAVYTAVGWVLGGVSQSKEAFMSPPKKRRML